MIVCANSNTCGFWHQLFNSLVTQVMVLRIQQHVVDTNVEFAIHYDCIANKNTSCVWQVFAIATPSVVTQVMALQIQKQCKWRNLLNLPSSQCCCTNVGIAHSTTCDMCLNLPYQCDFSQLMVQIQWQWLLKLVCECNTSSVTLMIVLPIQQLLSCDNASLGICNNTQHNYCTFKNICRGLNLQCQWHLQHQCCYTNDGIAN